MRISELSGGILLLLLLLFKEPYFACLLWLGLGSTALFSLRELDRFTAALARSGIYCPV